MSPLYSGAVELINPRNVHQVLLEKNAKVYLAARSEARAKAAIAELLTETGKEAIWLELDLSSLQSVEKAAAEFHGYGCDCATVLSATD
jgi:short-subunit dehydrogenase